MLTRRCHETDTTSIMTVALFPKIYEDFQKDRLVTDKK
jgi:hypothetical protein